MKSITCISQRPLRLDFFRGPIQETSMKLISLLFLSVPLVCSGAEIPSKPLAEKGELLLSEDFEKSELGELKPLIPTFTVEHGVLKGVQTREDHGAVGRFYRPMTDVVVEFKFQLAGSPSFNAVFDDQKFKGSHAGHICRVSFFPNKIRLADDKEGAMRNDIEQMRKDPARKAEADKLIEGRSASFPVTIEPNKWYHATIEVSGDQMRVLLDDKPVAYLKSPGIAHATKSSFHFTVPGKGVLFDDVRIWKAQRLSHEENTTGPTTTLR
jgi:hypothetical protein